MACKHALHRYQLWYAKLLRLYPKHYYDRFGESMEQTFRDILSERAHTGNMFGYVLWLFVETFTVILRENINFFTMKNKRLIGILFAVAFLLLIPLVAMQFTNEVVWTPGDFIFAGLLLGGTGVMFAAVMRVTTNRAYRIAFTMGLAGAFLLIWINGAVGIIGGEDNPANMLYGLVVAVGFFGAIISLFRPQGMARTAFTAAVVQACIPIVAFVIWQPDVSSAAAIVDLVRVIMLNASFVALFIGSGMLFQRASLPHAKT